MIVRAERAKSNIAKDMEKAKRIAPHEADYQTLRSIKNPSQQQLAEIQDYFILLEEFKVSLFAQELGTGKRSLPNDWINSQIVFEMPRPRDAQAEPAAVPQ